VQTVCNYVTLWFRNVASHLSDGDANGTWQFIQNVSAPTGPAPAFELGPNNESGPSAEPANGPQSHPWNFLHFNPYPNTASPGQTRECEAGNEDFIPRRKVIGNVPGNQGTRTEGQGRRVAPRLASPP
jgi:hypothetical protein